MRYEHIKAFDIPDGWYKALERIWTKGDSFFVGYGSEITETKKLNLTIPSNWQFNPGTGSVSTTQGDDITLLGGYTSGCGRRAIDPAGTVLQVSVSGRVLDLNVSNGGDIRVDGFTIKDGDLSGDGAGVYAASSSSSGAPGDVTLANNIVTGNSSSLASGKGGGVYAVSYTTTTDIAGDITLVNNIVTGNSADFGGGVYAGSFSSSGAAGDVTCTNNTLTDNNADYGGGIYLYASGSPGGSINAYNNIVWGNTASTGGDVYLNKGPNIANAFYNDGSDSAGDDWDYGDSTNFDLDPKLTSNYHLRPGSPCIDAGTNDAPALPATDVEDDQRMIDGDRNGTEIADIGADEFISKAILTFLMLLLN